MVAAVTVKCMPLGWLTRIDSEENFLGLVRILNNTSNKAILQTDFVNSLLEGYWETYKAKILITQFVPFLFYLGSMINWMVYALDDDSQNRPLLYHFVYFPLLGFCFMFIINQIICEYVQIREASSIREHFSNYWNMNDLCYLVLNITVMSCNMFDSVSLVW